MMYGGLKDDFSVSPDILIYALGEEKQVPSKVFLMGNIMGKI